MKKERKWLPTMPQLIDRLSIHQLKEVFVPENKENYAKEIKDMMHDIDMILEESDELRVVAGTATAVNAFASYLLSDNT